MDIPREKLLLMYERMLKIRHFETKVSELFATGDMPGFVHLYLGEEAVAVGACAALDDDDNITSTHRGHGHIIAKGGELKYMMAELYGKSTGYNKGKGGSMHIVAPQLGILGADGIVGGGIPIATGSGLSAKLQKTGRVTVCFFGDGASNQGTFHEAINIAASFSLPVVYVCENNLFGVGTRQCPAVRKIQNIADRAVGYSIPGVVVDGNDVLAVYGAASEAVERARAGEGPTLIECKTYRWRTHFEGEPDTYRDPAEVKEWLAKEPIGRFKAALVKQGVLTEDEAQAIEQRVIEELEEAVRFAYDSPEPAVAEALTDVYAG
ncbi:MAG: acetoin:2,6-dichlorophenolindophenol oxidoreductase subunit alpha [Anaerolineae bacterium SM23_84]|nr:MAG: acetoin:2,6-dichlorophenolindophenol oxidoreductase subunit alpha [Anaerolineae bacterium SM23_84]